MDSICMTYRTCTLIFCPNVALKSVEMSLVLKKTCLKKRQTMKSSKIRSQESFVKNLLESYSVSFVIYQYLSIFLSSKSWIESIRAIIQPIRKDIFKRKYLFNGNLNCKNQNKSLSPFLLALKSMLPGGEVNIKIKCSQAVLALSEIVT